MNRITHSYSTDQSASARSSSPVSTFADALQAERRAEHIITLAMEQGIGLLGAQSTASEREVRLAAREWIGQAQSMIETMTPADALIIISSLDTMHRLAYNTPADPALTDRYTMRAFEAYIRGDRKVDIYRLLRAVGHAIDRRRPAFLGRPLRWEADTIARWYSDFRFGASISRLTPYDTLMRVAALLTHDLRPFEGSNVPRFKHLLATTHLPLATPHNPATPNFLSAATPHL